MIADLADKCWQELAHKAPDEIAMESVAQMCDVSHQQAVLHGGDITHLILHKCEALDDEALATSFDDFADDPAATIYEKILEGLMMRFELMAASRPQFDQLHRAARSHPVLAAHCLHQLSATIGKLLFLAGDETSGWRKQARIAGVVAVLLRVRTVWQEDDSPDLGLTMKALDKELKTACEWALSLRVLSQDDLDNDDLDKEDR